MAILSNPKITPDHVTQQLLKKNTQSQKQQATVPAPVTEADDSVRHPLTAKWTRGYQNKQIVTKSMDTKAPTK